MLKKEDRVKIDIRKEILELIHKKYSNISVGDYDLDEIDIVLDELKEIAEMVRDKDKLMEWYQQRRHTRNKNISKYFNFDK